MPLPFLENVFLAPVKLGLIQVRYVAERPGRVDVSTVQLQRTGGVDSITLYGRGGGNAIGSVNRTKAAADRAGGQGA